MKRAKRFDLSSEQTVRLLQLGLEQRDLTGAEPRETQRDLLLDMLRTRLPVDGAIKETLPALLQPMSGDLTSISGPSMGEALKHHTSDPALLRRIKEHAKSLGTAAQDTTTRQAALAVYLAAIAAALVFHKLKISEQSCPDLRNSFETFGQYAWIPEPFKTLYSKAKARCEDHP